MSSKLLESVRMVWDTLWGLVSPPHWGIRPKIAYTVQLYMIWYYHQLFDLIVSEIAMQGVWWVSQKVEVPEARVIFAKRRSSRRHFCSSASSPQCLPCVWVVSQNSWQKQKSSLHWGRANSVEQPFHSFTPCLSLVFQVLQVLRNRLAQVCRLLGKLRNLINPLPTRSATCPESWLTDVNLCKKPTVVSILTNSCLLWFSDHTSKRNIC